MPRFARLALGIGAGILVSAIGLTVLRQGPLAPDYTPSWQHFPDGSNGIVVLEANGMCPFCQWQIDRTDDGGRSWRRSKSDHRQSFPEESIRQPGNPLDIQDVVREGAVAWAVREVETFPLAVTDDGGRTWRDSVNPCPKRPRIREASVAGVSPSQAWVLCSGGFAHADRPDAAQAKALYATTDGGRSWRRTAAVDTHGAMLAGRGLPTRGQTDRHSLSFGDPQFGLIVPFDSPPVTTRDGGETWARIRLGEQTDSIWNGQASSGRDAYLLGVANMKGKRRFTLYATHDRAETWHPSRRWYTDIPREQY